MINMNNRRIFKIDDIVYAWSNERYGQAHLVECLVQKVSGDDIECYAMYDNRAFWRNKHDVLTYDELMVDVKTIIADHKEDLKDIDEDIVSSYDNEVQMMAKEYEETNYGYSVDIEDEDNTDCSSQQNIIDVHNAFLAGFTKHKETCTQ